MRRLLIYLALLSLGFSCTEKSQKAQELIDQVRTKYAPDQRTALFQVEISAENPLILHGETNLRQAKDSLLSLMQQHQIAVIDSIVVLPDENTEKPFALINVSVANLRSAPQHSAELATQALLGTPVLVLKARRGWCLVQTPDSYIAWTNEESLQLCSRAELERWKSVRKIIYTQTSGYAMDTLQQHRVSDLVAGNILEVKSEADDSWSILYPDGRAALIRKSEAEEWQSWLNHTSPAESSIVEKALEFQGIPYLWGGTSAKGMDCSGFTKTVYMLQGIILPRDASQQVYVGEPIDSVGDFSKLKTGDLLFFGSKKEDGPERVVHVGLWLGNMQFIHASGDVHMSSMDSASAQYDEFNRKRYLRAKRVSVSNSTEMANLFGWL
ncbi:MAG: C40 family peptidase [Cyclobacteriaceae bacterium]|nr:C40 family peptidase [Cyclobacteriaceae bacterium]